jgi:hypothetical protein
MPRAPLLHHHDLGADSEATIKVGHVLVHHADAADDTFWPIVLGSLVPWMR